MAEHVNGLTLLDRTIKRLFDIILSTFGLAVMWWFIALAYIIAMIDTRKSGFFTQDRVGKDGKVFRVIKIRTMRDIPTINTTVTTAKDRRITFWGHLFRTAKIDELPQLVNVLIGDMSFVGPRPDMPGYADHLTGDDKIILSVRPGITGPATLKYRNEEKILAGQSDPERYNREVIFPDKVRLNREYVEHYSLWTDIKYIVETIFS